MGCDIHMHAERRGKTAWIYMPHVKPFEYRSYGVFAWLADVRNYSAITPFTLPRGLPVDASRIVAGEYAYELEDIHTPSWLSIAELLAVDYEQIIEDRRYCQQIGVNAWNGSATAAPGMGKYQTLRAFLGQQYFADLKAAHDAGAERIVFWFDN